MLNRLLLSAQVFGSVVENMDVLNFGSFECCRKGLSLKLSCAETLIFQFIVNYHLTLFDTYTLSARLKTIFNHSKRKEEGK